MLVVGSVNVDLVLEVPRHPDPGETLSSTRSHRFPGGKGANQACVTARLGGDVRFAGRTGTGDSAERAVSLMREANVDLSGVTAMNDVETGLAVVTLDDAGENSIILTSGANGTWSPQHVREMAGEIAASDVVITQGEIPAAAVDELATLCSRTGARFVLNLAPVIDVATSTLTTADPLVVNESEGRLVLGKLTDSTVEQEDDPGIVAALSRLGVPSVIMTRSARGALVDESGATKEIASPAASAVDTTGAGDAFVGALGFGLAQRESLLEASSRAVRVGAFSVARHGAQPSYPWSTDLLPA